MPVYTTALLSLSQNITKHKTINTIPIIPITTYFKNDTSNRPSIKSTIAHNPDITTTLLHTIFIPHPQIILTTYIINTIYDPIPYINARFNPLLPINPIINPLIIQQNIINVMPVYAISISLSPYKTKHIVINPIPIIPITTYFKNDTSNDPIIISTNAHIPNVTPPLIHTISIFHLQMILVTYIINTIYDPIPNINTYFNPLFPINPIINPLIIQQIIINVMPVYAISISLSPYKTKHIVINPIPIIPITTYFKNETSNDPSIKSTNAHIPNITPPLIHTFFISHLQIALITYIINTIYDPIPNINTYFNPLFPINPIINPLIIQLNINITIPVYSILFSHSK